MNKNHSPYIYIYIYIALAFMLLIASCDKPQSENKASSSSSVDTENGEANPEVKPEHSFSFLQASHRIALTATSYTKAVTEAHKPTDDTRKTAYSSSNDDIATVDDNGEVTFVTAGIVTIKAEKQKEGKHVLRSTQYTLYITINPTGKAALANEITRATTAHGDEVDLNYIDTSAITNMENMFAKYGGYKLAKFNGDISKWDVSQVTNMLSMFYGSAFNGDISKWDVSQVTTMRHMFNSSAFNGDILKWKVAQVTNMRSMFENAKAFNQDISAWNVSRVTNMELMFSNASAFNGDISKWDVSQVTNMAYMFDRATAFMQDLESWEEKLHADIKDDNMFQGSGVAASIPSWCTGDCDHKSTR